jgi:hypothetical protein
MTVHTTVTANAASITRLLFVRFHLVVARPCPGWEAHGKFREAISPRPGRPGYGNGRHRITAILDSGVRRTAVLRWKMLSGSLTARHA